MPLERLDHDAGTGDVVAALRRDGAVVIREQVPGDLVEAVLAALRERFGGCRTCSQRYDPGR